MQYNNNSYDHDGRAHAHQSSTHHPRQSHSNIPSDFTSDYPSQQHPHGMSTYQAGSSPPAGTYLGNSPTDVLHPLPFSGYSQHGPSVTADGHRPYYAPPAAAPTYSQSQPPTHSTPRYPAATSTHMVSQHGHHNAPRHSQQFVTTPVQAYQATSSASTSTSHRSRSTMDPYYHMSGNPQHSGHSSSPPYPSSSRHVHSHSAPVGDRYPCELCDRTFTRSHDRRRHYETVHAAVPTMHKCRHCKKDFSRADSLKRHCGNGCGEEQ
ncbi:hypothetical protein BV22DRAFT_1035392 [Leucogyrophana mollusca]|uniref:Uncharacterized protein n=1 Tax=Leucogyrophana mollusca TaxID=85980 RepID=A0ACB8BEK1_9AGAM|nr:hypothetical protein BV22DRAFT_1035392 [Leucogyrophana mollusca]